MGLGFYGFRVGKCRNCRGRAGGMLKEEAIWLSPVLSFYFTFLKEMVPGISLQI